MSWDTIVDKLAEVLLKTEPVAGKHPGVGVVHKYRRHTTFWNEYFRDHVKDQILNSWEITRRGVTEALTDVGGAVSVEPTFSAGHQVSIHGMMAVDDLAESERQFQRLIDGIRDEFRVDTTLGGVLEFPANIQVPEISHRTFGGSLVHFVQLTLNAVESVGGC